MRADGRDHRQGTGRSDSREFRRPQSRRSCSSCSCSPTSAIPRRNSPASRLAAPIFQTYVPLLNKYLLVSLSAIFVFTAITRGNYKIVERIFFAFCVIYLTYVVSAFVVHPPWGQVLRQMVWPHFSPTNAYLFTAIAVIGTTISPWMQFYIQSAVVEKGVKAKDYAYSRIDVISGAVFTDIIAFFIIVASAATIFVYNAHVPAGHKPIAVNDAGDVAAALAPLAGKYASLLFALGLLNAAIFTASILPLSTAYYVCEAFGFESGVGRRFSEARIFYILLSLLDRDRRRVRAAAGSAAPEHDRVHPGAQRRAPAGRSRSHAVADQQPADHGQVHQRPSVQHHRVGDGRDPRSS